MFSQDTKRDIVNSWTKSVGAVALCSPLELIKMNAQVTSSQKTIGSMFKSVYKTHGFKGFYKGLGVSLLAQPGYWTFYLPIYNNLKKRYSNNDGTIDFQKKMGIVFGSSMVASMTVNPLFVFKTRFQTSVLKTKPDGTLKYPKMNYLKMAKDIARKEGIRGFYKGNLVAQIKNTQMIIQMPLYDYLNEHPGNPLKKNNFILFDKSFVSGIVSKTVASCVVFYPVDCIRTNIRDNVQNKSIAQIVKQIYSRPGGALNFYRGVGIYWLSAVPTFGTFMYLYESFDIMNLFSNSSKT